MFFVWIFYDVQGFCHKRILVIKYKNLFLPSSMLDIFSDILGLIQVHRRSYARYIEDNRVSLDERSVLHAVDTDWISFSFLYKM